MGVAFTLLVLIRTRLHCVFQGASTRARLLHSKTEITANTGACLHVLTCTAQQIWRLMST